MRATQAVAAAPWRRRSHELLVAVAIVAALAPAAVLAVNVARTASTTDFLCFWTGAAFVLDGRDPYDEAAWTAATAGASIDAFGRTRSHNCPLRYAYPLTTALAMWPLGVMPLEFAAVLWQLAIWLGTAAGVAVLARAARLERSRARVLAVVVFASQPFFATVLSAQFGGLVVLAVALLAAPELRVADGAGLGFVLVWMKPHAAPLVALARVRDLRAGMVMPAGVLLACSLVVDVQWPVKWIAELVGHRREMFDESVSVWMLAGVAGVPSWAAGAVVLAVVGALVLAMRRARDVAPLDRVAAAAIAWQVVVPYGLTADHLAPLALVAAAALRRAPRWGVVAVLLVVGVLPWALYAVRFDLLASYGLEVTGALVPLAAALVLAATLRWGLRG